MDSRDGLAEIKANAEPIVSAIGRKSVDDYLRLSWEYAQGRVDKNEAFQATFRRFYRLDNAGLTLAFKSRYFEFLESLRGSKYVDAKAIAWELYAFPNRKGQRTLQFSFVTKLANTINPDYPIYDSLVAHVFGFRPGYYYRPVEERLRRLLDFYVELEFGYHRILNLRLLYKPCQMFRELYLASPSDVPDIKVLDFVFWSAGRLGYRARLAGP